MKFPLLGRAAAIAGVALLILLPIALIDGKIAERRNRAEGVERQFAAETSGPQAIVGPLLALTCEETFTEERQIMRAGKAETVSDKRVAPCPTGYFTPRALKVLGTMPVESRHRGIYPIRLYRAGLDMTGEIEWPAPAPWNGLNPRVWKEAYLVMAVSDARGIKQLSAPLKGGKGSTLDARFTYQSDLGEYPTTKATAGVSIFEPVNVYALSYRATEYGFLFVLFTFAALAMAEVLAGVRLHAIQYLLVGTALAVFFLLLIALSEHIAFARAYLAASVACIALLTLYLRHPLQSLLRSVAFLMLLVGLYATLYVLLKSEDHALLMGSVMVFGVLSVAMIATRKLDWAALSKRMLNTETPLARSA